MFNFNIKSWNKFSKDIYKYSLVYCYDFEKCAIVYKELNPKECPAHNHIERNARSALNAESG